MKNKKLGRLINVLFEFGINKFHYDSCDLWIEGDICKNAKEFIKLHKHYEFRIIEPSTKKIVKDPPHFKSTITKRLPETIVEEINTSPMYIVISAKE